MVLLLGNATVCIRWVHVSESAASSHSLNLQCLDALVMQVNLSCIRVFAPSQLFNGTFSRAVEAGGVELLMQKLEKFFYRVRRPHMPTPVAHVCFHGWLHDLCGFDKCGQVVKRVLESVLSKGLATGGDASTRTFLLLWHQTVAVVSHYYKHICRCCQVAAMVMSL